MTLHKKEIKANIKSLKDNEVIASIEKDIRKSLLKLLRKDHFITLIKGGKSNKERIKWIVETIKDKFNDRFESNEFDEEEYDPTDLVTDIFWDIVETANRNLK